MKETAERFFEACETGQGWAVCKAYCKDDATFAAQAGPLADVDTLQGYTDWMQGMMALMPDAAYEVKSFAIDREKRNASVYAVFTGTHTGEGGPVPPTGKQLETDYVYVMDFDGDRIRHMTKIWNSAHALEQLGWT